MAQSNSKVLYSVKTRSCMRSCVTDLFLEQQQSWCGPSCKLIRRLHSILSRCRGNHRCRLINRDWNMSRLFKEKGGTNCTNLRTFPGLKSCCHDQDHQTGGLVQEGSRCLSWGFQERQWLHHLQNPLWRPGGGREEANQQHMEISFQTRIAGIRMEKSPEQITVWLPMNIKSFNDERPI